MGCVTNCILILVNILAVLVGGAIIGLSSYVVHTKMEYNKLMTDGVLMLPVWTLIGGIVLTVVGMFGFCGTLKKSPCLLRTYASLVLVFVVMELVCGVLLLVNRDYAATVLADRMMRMFKRYGGDDQSLTDSIDVAQHELQCCGVNAYSDWFFILNDNDVTPGCCTGRDGSSSDDCYNNINTLEPIQQLQERIYTRGCYVGLVEDLADETLALGIMCIALVVLQLACVIFAFVTASKINGKKERMKFGKNRK